MRAREPEMEKQREQHARARPKGIIPRGVTSHIGSLLLERAKKVGAQKQKWSEGIAVKQFQMTKLSSA